jgi:hypothetical protein
MVSFRKSKKFGPFRIGVSKRGVSGSVGAGPVRVSRGADGKVRRTVGVPGTGIYDTKVVGGRKKQEQDVKAVDLELRHDGPQLTDGQRNHLRRELERVGTRNMPDLSQMTVGDAAQILDAIGGEQLLAVQEHGRFWEHDDI